MRSFGGASAAAALLVFMAFGAGSAAAAEDPEAPPFVVDRKVEAETPESVIRQWPEESRAAARAMIAKYGKPSHFNQNVLVWIRNGPWRKTTVYRGVERRPLGKRETAFVEQTIVYRVPARRIDDLKRFDGRLEVDERRGRVSVRSESEAFNFLELNLVDEIVTGKRNLEQARVFYTKTARLANAGKSSPYMEGFLFRRQDLPR
jgi:hypothetical protein